jgi:hypothetical protein
MTDYQKRVVQALKTLIYDQNNLTNKQGRIFHKFIELKLRDKFKEEGWRYTDRGRYSNQDYREEFDKNIHDWAVDVYSNMFADYAFFDQFKHRNPDPEQVDDAKLFRKFKDKVDKKIAKIYEREMIKKTGVCDVIEQAPWDREDDSNRGKIEDGVYVDDPDEQEIW